MQLSFDELAQERWLPVPGYEGFYDVSDLGRIRSLPRTTTRGGIMKLAPNWDGYLRLSLSKCGAIADASVHRIVCHAFIGPCPEGLMVRHLDGNRQNNALANLKYGTSSDNALDRVRHGTHRNTAKTHCPANHEYTRANTILREGRSGNPWRTCRQCQTEQRRERYQREKEHRAA